MKAKKGNLSPGQRYEVDTTFYTRLAELQVKKSQRDSGVGIQQDDDPVDGGDDGGEEEEDGSDDDGEGSEDEEDSDGGDKEDPEDSSDAKDSGGSGDEKASDSDKDESEVGDSLISWIWLAYPANPIGSLSSGSHHSQAIEVR